MINEDGTAALIEAVYYQYHTIDAEEFDSVDEAVGFLDNGEDYGTLSSVGVFVDGQPHTWGWDNKPPTSEQHTVMAKAYAELQKARSAS